MFIVYPVFTENVAYSEIDDISHLIYINSHLKAKKLIDWQFLVISLNAVSRILIF